MTRDEAHSTLPALDEAQCVQSRAVATAVREAVRAAGGWLPFTDYLRIVLYAPGLGYYSAGSAKFGREGDFITAPELSPLFGRALARQCSALFAALSDTAPDILELGAGTGRLAQELLTGLDAQRRLPRRYLILEVSADLRARQQALLAQLPGSLRDRVQWLSAWPQTPIDGLVIANEVADAVPFERFVVGTQGFDVRGVALAPDGTLIHADRPAAPTLAAELHRLAAQWPVPLAPGYVSEVCPLLDPWIAGVAAVLRRGAVLLFDYGLPRSEYYHPQRDRGTMRCHFRHRVHEDALLYPGLQDITAWVDFTRVAEAAVDSGLDVLNYCTQAAFLLANGIEADVAAAPDALTRGRLASEARQLLLPGEMGETFKFIALGRAAPELDNVSRLQDLRRLL